MGHIHTTALSLGYLINYNSIINLYIYMQNTFSTNVIKPIEKKMFLFC